MQDTEQERKRYRDQGRGMAINKELQKSIAKGRKHHTRSNEVVGVWEGRGKDLEIITDLKEYISKLPAEPMKQSVFSFMPYELTRVSPFFPLNPREMKEDRPYDRSFTLPETSWGKMTLKGERLSIYDESILLALLVLLKKNKSLSFTITRYAICKIMGVKPQQYNYETIWNSLVRLTGTVIILDVKDKAKIASPILSGVFEDKKKGKTIITINKYFYEMYCEGLLANINMTLRSSLKGNYSKALYRFIAGQSGLTYDCHLLTLAKVINTNLRLSDSEIRKRIKKGLGELQAKNYLTKWLINKSDIVHIWKAKTPQK